MSTLSRVRILPFVRMVSHRNNGKQFPFRDKIKVVCNMRSGVLCFCFFHGREGKKTSTGKKRTPDRRLGRVTQIKMSIIVGMVKFIELG